MFEVAPYVKDTKMLSAAKVGAISSCIEYIELEKCESNRELSS